MIYKIFEKIDVEQEIDIGPGKYGKKNKRIRDHPLKTSACLRGGGVKNLPNLPMESSKKLPTEGGRGQKS